MDHAYILLLWFTCFGSKICSSFVISRPFVFTRTGEVSLFSTDEKKKRKMKLIQCGPDYCKDPVREKVVGDHNQVVLTGPATSQIAFGWENDPNTLGASVLVLVKQHDEELTKFAASVVKELAERANDLNILLEPSTAARIRHNYGVDRNVQLYEKSQTPGFGVAGTNSDTSDESQIYEEYSKQYPDLICTFGGDGLLMYVASLFQGPSPPILCVAGGSLGFLTPFHPEEAVDAILAVLGKGTVESIMNKSPVLNGSSGNSGDVFPPNMPTYPYKALEDSTLFDDDNQVCLSIRMRLECRIKNRQGDLRCRYNVLNELSVDRGSSPYLAALECFCDDVHLTTVQADGIIFATPTGSTAYSMAAGGSVVHPAVPCILVTPICPHVLSFRSMVFPDHVVLTCVLPDDARSSAFVSFDGKHRQELRPGDAVEVRMSRFPVPTINRKDHSSDWLGSLKRNFNFNTRPRQRPLE